MIGKKKVKKKQGISILAGSVKTDLDFDRLVSAVNTYHSECAGSAFKFVKNFDTWCRHWEDYAPESDGQTDIEEFLFGVNQ